MKNINDVYENQILSCVIFIRRSLEPVGEVLDSLSEAWKKWGDEAPSVNSSTEEQWSPLIRNKQSAYKPLIFSQ